MRPMDKPTANSRSAQSFVIIKNTGHGNFFIGPFQANNKQQQHFIHISITGFVKLIE